MKKPLIVILLLVLISAHAQIQPVIYKTFIYHDYFFERDYCTCYASNLDYGTLWVFEANTNLNTTNWIHWGRDYYTGWGTNYTIPYVMGSWPIDTAPRVFFRMRQVGTNFTFYTFYEP